MPTEKTQMDMFEEDLTNAVLGQVLQNDEDTQEEVVSEEVVEEV